MVPRGLKKLLQTSSPCKLVGKGNFKHFRLNGCKLKLKGLTKRLEKLLFSDGDLPMIAKASAKPAGGYWRGPDGGRRRGRAVDSQVSRLANTSQKTRNASNMLKLTRLVFSTCSVRKLVPIMGQRAVCCKGSRIGTAADLICYDTIRNALVVIELKCGHSGGRTTPFTKSGRVCKMNSPITKADDNIINRHLSQLAVTHHLFVSERSTIQMLHNMGIQDVYGLLFYANDTAVDVYELEDWWVKKANAILQKLK